MKLKNKIVLMLNILRNLKPSYDTEGCQQIVSLNIIEEFGIKPNESGLYQAIKNFDGTYHIIRLLTDNNNWAVCKTIPEKDLITKFLAGMKKKKPHKVELHWGSQIILQYNIH